MSMISLLRRYWRAGPEDAVDWYRKAHEIAAELDPDVERAAGILAALSPRVHWGRNITLARSIYAGSEVKCLGRSRRMAERIYAGEHPLDVMKGPKTRAFYANILEPDTSLDVTVDIWAARAVGRPYPTTPKAYASIAGAYVRLAQELQRIPSEVQARVWTGIRGRAE